MKMNKYGMNNSLVNYFSQSGKYELLKSGGIPPIAMGNSNLQDVSFYELRRVRNRSDLSVTQVPRFRDTLIDSSRPTPLSGYLLPVDPIPLVSDGNDRQGSDLRVCMIAFYHEQTFVSLTLYADPTVYDRALESILKPIYESLTFY
jgi:hypothetical protein